MKRLKSILASVFSLKRTAQTENLNIVSADESYEKLEGWFGSLPWEITDFHIYRRNIGLWGCFARQELLQQVEHPIVYLVEVYQFNRNAGTVGDMPDKLCIAIIWHYDTEGKRNSVPRFKTYLDKSANDVKKILLSNNERISDGHTLYMLPDVTTINSAMKVTDDENYKFKKNYTI